MNNALAKCIRVVGLFAMTALPLSLQAESARVAELQQTDPRGLILTMTAVLVVFGALAMLVLLFKGIGRGLTALSKKSDAKAPQNSTTATNTQVAPDNNEVAVAISMALSSARALPSDEAMVAISLSLEDYCSSLHDYESYRLTIRPRATQWNARSQSLRRYPR